jgi:hypothetical protein
VIPGVYDISNEDYHASDGISRSGIMQLIKSPFDFWDAHINEERLSRPEKQRTPSMLFGEAVHTYLLEPERFKNDYVVMPELRKGTKNYKQFIEENSGAKNFISELDLEFLKKIERNVFAHKIASKFIGHGKIEKSIYWNEKDIGVLCKARPDIWQKKLIWDVKTTSATSIFELEKSVYSYGYYIQAAMILDAIESVGEEYHTNFGIIAIRNSMPFNVDVFTLSDQAIEIGRQRYKDALKLYLECKKDNKWPSYSNDEVLELNLPRYAFL